MTAAWMLYAAAVGGLVGLAALALERVARAHRRSGRAVWGAAMCISLALPVGAMLLPTAERLPAAEDAAQTGVGGVAEAIHASTARLGTALDRIGPFVPPAWIACSLLLLVALGGGLRRLRTRSRTWPEADVLGARVLVSEGFGPAVFGPTRPRIVVPRWMLEGDPERLALAVLHEQEHVAAGDVRLLTAGWIAIVLAPWNPALWWQLRRLRAAVELDCDARVLRRGVPRARYGALLLDVATGPRRAVLPLAALAPPPHLLERRLEMIARDGNGMGRGRSALLLAGAVAAMLAACEATPPTQPSSNVEAAAAVERPDPAEPLGRVVRVGEIGEGDPLIYVDGVRLETGDGPRDLRELLDPDDIERIEILKGPAARMLFGPEAAAGVIQIFRKGAATPGA